MLPGEVGVALQEMVKPENLAAVGAVMVVFAGIQFIPGADVVIDLIVAGADVVIDLIVAGAAVYMLGSGAIDLIKTLVTLDANISSAKCEGDLDLAAKALAAGLVKSTGEVVGGAAAGYSSISGGGIRRIADGIRKVTEFAKGRFGVNGGEAYNIANAAKLAEQLTAQSARSPFTAVGKLTQEAINGAKEIISPGKLNNPAIPSGFGKYATDVFRSPAGDFTVHFYKNPTTGEVFYGLDYKAIFNSMSGK